MDARRIPFTEEDERRIGGAATWGFIVAITSIASSLIVVVLQAQQYFGGSHLRFVPWPMYIATAVQALLSILFNALLLQASLSFRKVAVTDEADQAHLLMGFRRLRAYFMLQVIMILLVFCAGLLLAVIH
jgi:hypothetical protein